MPKFYISLTVSVDADDFDGAYEKADEIAEQVADRVSHAYDVNHWNVEQDEFGKEVLNRDDDLIYENIDKG